MQGRAGGSDGGGGCHHHENVQRLTPTSCNLRDIDILFMIFAKPISLGNFGNKSGMSYKAVTGVDR